MRALLVRWIDSQGDPGWQQRKTAIREAHDSSLAAVTVGFLVEETDDWLLLAMGAMDGDNVIHDTMQIPKVAVLETIDLAHETKDQTEQ